MFSRLLLLFILVPLLDLFLLIWLAQFLTWPVTVSIVILSGVLGAWLAAWQGRAVQGKIQDRLARNQMPSGSLISDGAIILFAAALLLTPGLLTDLFGLTLLVPPMRNGYKSVLSKWFRNRIQFQSFTVDSFSQFQSPANSDSDILEGHVVDPNEDTQPDERPLNHLE